MTIAFRKVSEPYGWMSNMSPHPIDDGDGKVYRTSEAIFQATRFVDEDIRKLICDAKSPMGAKMLAKKNAEKMVIKPRSPMDLVLMRFIVRLKVQQHPELAAKLVRTGDEEIVEDCTARQNESGLFWGAAKQADGTWKGENMLGKIWMEVRQELVELAKRQGSCDTEVSNKKE